MQIIDTFSDSVMSVCLTKTEIIGGSVDGTVRTFDIRLGRYFKIGCDLLSWDLKEDSHICIKAIAWRKRNDKAF